MKNLKITIHIITDDNDNQIENVSLTKPSTTDHPLYNNVVEDVKLCLTLKFLLIYMIWD